MIRILLLSFALSVNFRAESGAEEITLSIDHSITESDFTDDLEPAQKAKSEGFDYNGPALKAWHKNAPALQTFLEQVPLFKLDGAASEIHHSVLIQLMMRWGDIDFAKAIPHNDHAAVEDLKRRLKRESGLIRFFPETAKVLDLN